MLECYETHVLSSHEAQVTDELIQIYVNSTIPTFCVPRDIQINEVDQWNTSVWNADEKIPEVYTFICKQMLPSLHIENICVREKA